MKIIICLLSLLVLGHTMSYSSLPKSETKGQPAELCTACGKNILGLAYPKVFTVHRVDNDPHTFHTDCLHNWVITEKKFNCQACGGNLSLEQVSRLHFAHDFPEEIMKELSFKNAEKLRKHCTEKINNITKLLNAENVQFNEKKSGNLDTLFGQLFTETFLNRRNKVRTQGYSEKDDLMQEKQKLMYENEELKKSLENLRIKNKQLIEQKNKDNELMQEKTCALNELKKLQSVDLLKKNEEEISALKAEIYRHMLHKNIAVSLAGAFAVSTCFLSYKAFYRK